MRQVIAALAVLSGCAAAPAADSPTTPLQAAPIASVVVAPTEVSSAYRPAPTSTDLPRPIPHAPSEPNPVAETQGVVLHRIIPQVRACYARALGRDPSVSGSLRLKITIAPSGEVKDVSTGGSTLGDRIALECMERAVRAATFPPSDTGEDRVLTLPTNE